MLTRLARVHRALVPYFFVVAVSLLVGLVWDLLVDPAGMNADPVWMWMVVIFSSVFLTYSGVVRYLDRRKP